MFQLTVLAISKITNNIKGKTDKGRPLPWFYQFYLLFFVISPDDG
jgi:hypothetical protein